MPEESSPCSTQEQRRAREARGVVQPAVNSTGENCDQEEDFVVLDEDTMEAEWDGDQTKYLPPPPPTTYRSLLQSAEHVWKDVVSEGESLMKHSMPLAKDLGIVAKGAAVVAKDLMGSAVSSWMPSSSSSSSSPSSSSSAAAARANSGSPAARDPDARTSTTTTYGIVTTTTTKPTESNHPLTDSETTAIANALIDDELSTADVETEEVRVFLVAYRRAKVMEMEEIPLGGKPVRSLKIRRSWRNSSQERTLR
ncbi:MAG: hypothetical protein Q9216_004455 [Gyalolechia sp. 2 TL-2023]